MAEANKEWTNIAKSIDERRLPIYLLLDTSGSMSGAPIQAVQHGVEQFKKEVEKDTFAKETVYVGVITFGGENADFLTKGLVSIVDFQPPSLNATGSTPLGAAFKLLSQSLDKDIKENVKGGAKGDWKPLIFILTDGAPTDDWQSPREEIIKRSKKKALNIITVGCGPHINEEQLKAISTGKAFKMDDTEKASFVAFFEWVSQSVMTVSKECAQPGGEDKPIEMPKPPDVIQYIP